MKNIGIFRPKTCAVQKQIERKYWMLLDSFGQYISKFKNTFKTKKLC